MILLAKTVNIPVNKPEKRNHKMVDRKRDKDYIRKVVRMPQNYIVLCDFLDFYAGYKGENKFKFYNSIFNYSLKKIDSDVGYRFKKSSKSGYGITRSFFLNKKTYDLLHSTYKKAQQLYKKLYDGYLSMGNFTELVLYIYITDNIEKKILDVFKFDFRIEKIT